MKGLLSKFVAALVAYGPWGLFLIGLIDSFGIPLPAAMDALLIVLAVHAPGRAYFAAAVAVVGSTLGNIMLFEAVRLGRRTVLPRPGESGRFREWFDRYGLITLFVPAAMPLLPLPLKVFVVSAALLHTPLLRFVGVVLLARVLRYFGVVFLAVRLGSDAQNFLRRNVWSLVGVALLITVALYLLAHFNDRRRRSTSS